MKEIRIASANTLYRIDAYIADIERDIDMIERCEEQLGDGCLELHIEKEYKCIIRQYLIDMKKNLIDTINLEKQAENAIKNKHTADLSATRGESEEQNEQSNTNGAVNC